MAKNFIVWGNVQLWRNSSVAVASKQSRFRFQSSVLFLRNEIKIFFRQCYMLTELKHEESYVTFTNHNFSLEHQHTSEYAITQQRLVNHFTPAYTKEQETTVYVSTCTTDITFTAHTLNNSQLGGLSMCPCIFCIWTLFEQKLMLNFHTFRNGSSVTYLYKYIYLYCSPWPSYYIYIYKMAQLSPHGDRLAALCVCVCVNRALGGAPRQAHK